MRLWLLLFTLTIVSTLNAETKTPKYYPQLKTTSDELKNQLFAILSKHHKPNSNGSDEILDSCTDSSCYIHTEVSYKKAREYLFGFLHLEGNSPTTYGLNTYYCVAKLDNNDFPKHEALGPMLIPDAKIINAEHAWPQSKFTGKYPKNKQKADLHILFPVNSVVNSIRQNLPYGIVTEPTKDVCPEALSGRDSRGVHVFEPNPDDKGDMARATFYFSIRYQSKIDETQEAILRQWSAQDPVDAKEVIRNERIFTIQMDRNPFIDFPKLEEKISDF